MDDLDFGWWDVKMVFYVRCMGSGGGVWLVKGLIWFFGDVVCVGNRWGGWVGVSVYFFGEVWVLNSFIMDVRFMVNVYVFWRRVNR